MELPDTGRELEEAKPFGVVESVKAVSDLFAPLSGSVTSHERARWPSTPEHVNSDPYGDGWMIKITVRRSIPDRRPARRRGVRRPRRGGLTGRCRTAHTRRPTASGCWRRSASTASTTSSPTSRPTCGRAPSTCRIPSPSSSWRRVCARWPAATGRTSCRSSARASTGTGARRLSTSSCCAASGTRPTRRTSPRSARARSSRSTNTSR